MLSINIMKSVELEMCIKDLDKDIDKTINKIDIQTTFIDAKYSGDKLRDKELINTIDKEMLNLIKLINTLKAIEMEAIQINDTSVYFKCENRIEKLINIMEALRSKYLF